MHYLQVSYFKTLFMSIPMTIKQNLVGEGEIEVYSYCNEKIIRLISLEKHMGRCHKHFFALTNCFNSESTRAEPISGLKGKIPKLATASKEVFRSESADN